MESLVSCKSMQKRSTLI